MKLSKLKQVIVAKPGLYASFVFLSLIVIAFMCVAPIETLCWIAIMSFCGGVLASVVRIINWLIDGR